MSIEVLSNESQQLTVVSVEEYQTPSGTLVLKHNYPPSSASSTITHVNIDHVLETVKSTDIQVGSWVNIIGYVTAGEKIAKQPTARQSLKAKDPPRQPHVQAIVLWSAGSVNLDAYEKAVEQRKLLDSTSG
jgi:hypothetical protein